MKFNCPCCSGAIQADEVYGGTNIQCPNCGKYITAPEAPSQTIDGMAQIQSAGPQINGVQPVAITDFKIPFSSVFRLLLQMAIVAIVFGSIALVLFFVLMFLIGVSMSQILGI